MYRSRLTRKSRYRDPNNLHVIPTASVMNKVPMAHVQTPTMQQAFSSVIPVLIPPANVLIPPTNVLNPPANFFDTNSNNYPETYNKKRKKRGRRKRNQKPFANKNVLRNPADFRWFNSNASKKVNNNVANVPMEKKTEKVVVPEAPIPAEEDFEEVEVASSEGDAKRIPVGFRKTKLQYLNYKQKSFFKPKFYNFSPQRIVVNCLNVADDVSVDCDVVSEAEYDECEIDNLDPCDAIEKFGKIIEIEDEDEMTDEAEEETGHDINNKMEEDSTHVVTDETEVSSNVISDEVNKEPAHSVSNKVEEKSKCSATNKVTEKSVAKKVNKKSTDIDSIGKGGKESVSSKGNRLLQDFILPSLRDCTFGDNLKWDTKDRSNFLLKWTHKSRSTWSRRDAAVFLAWDRMKGRPEANNSDEFVNSKQRLRAALRDLKTVKEVDYPRVVGYRRYKILAMEGVRNNEAEKSKLTTSAAGPKTKIPDLKLNVKRENNMKRFSQDKIPVREEFRCNKNVTSMVGKTKTVEENFRNRIITRSLRGKKPVKYYESDSDREMDDLTKFEAKFEEAAYPHNKLIDKIKVERPLEDGNSCKKHRKRNEDVKKNWISEIHRKNEIKNAANKILAESHNFNNQLKIKPSESEIQNQHQFGYIMTFSDKTEKSENTKCKSELIDERKKWIDEGVKPKMEFMNTGKSKVFKNGNTKSNVNEVNLISELKKAHMCYTDSSVIDNMMQMNNKKQEVKNKPQLTNRISYNFQKVKVEKIEKSSEILEKNRSKDDSVEKQMSVDNVYCNNVALIRRWVKQDSCTDDKTPAKSDTDFFVIDCIKKSNNKAQEECSSKEARSQCLNCINHNFQNLTVENLEKSSEKLEENARKIGANVKEQINAGGINSCSMAFIKIENPERKNRLLLDGLPNHYVEYQRSDIQLGKSDVLYERTKKAEDRISETCKKLQLETVMHSNRISETNENFEQNPLDVVQSNRIAEAVENLQNETIGAVHLNTEMNANDTETQELLPKVVLLYNDIQISNSGNPVNIEPQIFASDTEDEDPWGDNQDIATSFMVEELNIFDKIISDDIRRREKKLLNTKHNLTEAFDTSKGCKNSLQDPTQSGIISDVDDESNEIEI